MGISAYLKNIRRRIGTELVLIPGVAAIIRDEAGRILFQRRAEDGLWSLPSGSIDPGETPAAAVIREVREETGLQVEPVAVVGVFGGLDYRMQYANGDVAEYTVVVFECRVLGGTLGGLDDETLELRYCSAAERPKLDDPFPDAIFQPFDPQRVLFT